MSINYYIENNTIQTTPRTIEDYLVDFLSNVHVDKLIDFANLKDSPDHDIICAMEDELDRMVVKIQEAIEEGEYSE